ncbi:hypothetical protein LEP1GSC072_3970 [Leptospira noguchii str. Bonito]|nr:hypothetical protein LEP1GSC072_3970 [Leptospira noguchii str. Bonito]
MERKELSKTLFTKAFETKAQRFPELSVSLPMGRSTGRVLDAT